MFKCHKRLSFQAVKLLYAEKGKKNKTNVFFLVGDRILNYVAENVVKDKTLTEYLK